MLGGQRENALLPGDPRIGESPEIKRDNAMNEKEFAAKLKHWLDRSAAGIGEFQATKLKAARLRALDAFGEPLRLLGVVTITGGTAQAVQYRVFPQALLWAPGAALLAALAIES